MPQSCEPKQNSLHEETLPGLAIAALCCRSVLRANDN